MGSRIHHTRADGSLRNLVARLSRVDVLIIDDWAMAPLQDAELRDFWEICEERYQSRSTILTSQVPVAQWHERIGDIEKGTRKFLLVGRVCHSADQVSGLDNTQGR